MRDVLVLPEFVITDEDFTAQLDELLAKIAEIEKYYKKSQQFRQKLQAVSRQMKPKQHRSLRYGLARNMVQISRIIRNVAFSTAVRPQFGGAPALRGRGTEAAGTRDRPRCSASWKSRQHGTGIPHAICARNCGSAASASSSWKKNAAPVPLSCGVRCRS